MLLMLGKEYATLLKQVNAILRIHILIQAELKVELPTAAAFRKLPLFIRKTARAPDGESAPEHTILRA
jgi:hypothetical protein